jgi:hypothetical protein
MPWNTDLILHSYGLLPGVALVDRAFVCIDHLATLNVGPSENTFLTPAGSIHSLGWKSNIPDGYPLSPPAGFAHSLRMRLVPFDFLIFFSL